MGLHTLLIECASEIASNLCCVHDPVIRERLGVGTPPLGRNGFADMAAGCVSASTEIGHSTRRMGSRVTVSSARNVHESGSRNVEASSNAVGASNIGPGRSRVALEQNAPHASTLNRLRRTPTASTSSLLTHRLARIFIGSGTAKSTSSLATPTGSGIRLQQDANRLAVITKNMSHGHSLGAMLQPRNNVPQPFDGKHIGECTLTVELSSMMLGIPVAGKAAATCNDIAPI